MSTWQVLIGDAAHACYNYAGQGTNLALEDGLILEEILVRELEVSGSSGERNLIFENIPSCEPDVSR